MSVPATPGRRLLSLVLSVRKITAQVTDASTTTILAMASSDESRPPRPAGVAIRRFPRHCWGSDTAADVGERLASRLKEIGVDRVDIDAEEEISRPTRQRMMVLPLFESVRWAGIEIGGGVERLGSVRFVGGD
ncbi:hypothetical protein MLD38_035715 [Melastoma candidum]|uniref:Uncharacterized protein n=1 Tax=Melastoma candidum TaxID=119954 RepID=A0ACB9LHG6_9MYRT|nr:hypothetical protein MLD38_035715 [Melastoma candidum]